VSRLKGPRPAAKNRALALLLHARAADSSSVAKNERITRHHQIGMLNSHPPANFDWADDTGPDDWGFDWVDWRATEESNDMHAPAPSVPAFTTEMAEWLHADMTAERIERLARLARLAMELLLAGKGRVSTVEALCGPSSPLPSVVEPSSFCDCGCYDRIIDDLGYPDTVLIKRPALYLHAEGRVYCLQLACFERYRDVWNAEGVPINAALREMHAILWAQWGVPKELVQKIYVMVYAVLYKV
jgi:hypothetical protein